MAILRAWNGQQPPLKIKVFPLHTDDFASSHTGCQRELDYLRNDGASARASGIHQPIQLSRPQPTGPHPH